MPNVCENAKWRRNRILNALYLFRWLYIVFINKTHKACYQALSTLDFTWVIYLMINIDNIRANFLSGIFLVVICYRAALCTHIETNSASQMLSFIFIVRSDSFTEVLSPFFNAYFSYNSFIAFQGTKIISIKMSSDNRVIINKYVLFCLVF